MSKLSALGYYTKADMESVKQIFSKEKFFKKKEDSDDSMQSNAFINKFISRLYVHDVLNALSIVATSVAGIARLVLAYSLHNLIKNEDALTDEAKEVFKKLVFEEIIRGIAEIAGLGLIISAIEIIFVNVLGYGKNKTEDSV